MDHQGAVRDLLQGKKGNLWTTQPDCTVYEAIRQMGEKDIGALVVLEHGKVVGVLSERDYSRKVVLMGRTSRDTKVGEIISRDVVAVSEHDSIGECMKLMTANRIRHLPVVDPDGELQGVVSIGDVVNWVIHQQSHTIQQLHGYISGEYPG